MRPAVPDLHSRSSGQATDHTFTFYAHRAIYVPLEILSRFVDRATRNLPPSR